jgi:hypothetical protein
MAKSNLWSEKNKKKVAAGAVLVCGFLIIYQFFLSGGPTPQTNRSGTQSSAARQAPTPAVTPTPKSAPVPRPDSGSSKEAALQALLNDTTPLDFTGQRPVAGAETERGNIFAYFVPTPTPPLPTPPPPPIMLRVVQPSNVVAGTPKTVTLVVVGDHFPADPQIIYGGVPKPTKKAEGALTTEIAPADYSFARNVAIEVKSQTKPAESYSNQIAFVIQAAPAIPFRMAGKIGDSVVLEFPGTPNKEYTRFHKGDLVMQFWRIDAIDSSGVDVTDTRYDIKKRVPFEEKR